MGSIELIEDEKVEKQFEDKETKIGQKLTETTSKKIIIIVLVIMISIPIFNSETYLQGYNYFQSGVDTLHLVVNQKDFSLDSELFKNNWNFMVDHPSQFNATLINLQVISNSVKSGGVNTVLKEYGTSSSLNYHRSYEFDGNDFS